MLKVAETAPGVPGPQGVDGASMPYPGLRPFSERDSRLFFGREKETASLLGLLERQQLVVVHGASGCGKSSLVRAGIVPVFRMDAMANGKQGHVLIVRPADAGGPLVSLARKLDKEIGLVRECAEGEDPACEMRSWSTILTTSQDWAADISARVADAGATLCIIFDQFEEVFPAIKAGNAAQVRRIIEFLNRLCEPSPEGTALGGRTLSVIVTMRSDYLGQCAIWDGFAETVNRSQYLLPRISSLGLLRAIHEPAIRFGGSVSDSVAESLLCIVKAEMDGLPIVQHALMRAWALASEGDGPAIIDDAAMTAVGGADNALSNHADEVLAVATAGDARLAAAADWMLRTLSDLDSDGRIIRRSPTLAQLAREVGVGTDTVTAILAPFRSLENSLIMPLEGEELTDNTIVSVSHEALLRQWKRVSEAAFDDQGRVTGLAYREFQDGMIWRSLSVQAQQFARDGTSILGPAATEQRLPWYRDIAQRPDWIGRHEKQAWLAGRGEVRRHWDEVAAFMQASEANLERQKEKLEEERRLVASLQRSQRIQSRLQVVIAALSLLIIGFVGWQWYQQRLEAHQQAQAAAVAREERRTAQLNLYTVRTQTANFVAHRYCAGRDLEGGDYQACFTDRTAYYLRQLEEQDRERQLARAAAAQQEQVDFNALPQSPYGGGFAAEGNVQGGSR